MHCKRKSRNSRWQLKNISQLYGSTTIVMASLHYSLHFALKMAKFDPLPETSEWTDWKNIWHDWLRHRPKWSSKIRFRKNFQGLRYIYATYKVLCFFLTLYALWHGYSLNGWTDFDAQYLKRRRLVRGGAFYMIERNRNLTLTFKR